MAVGAYRRLQLTPRLPGSIPSLVLHPAAGLVRRAGRRAVRLAEPAHQGLLPRCGDAGRAVLRRSGCSPRSLVLQLQLVGLVISAPQRASSAVLRHRFERRSRAKYLFVLLSSSCARACRQELGARPFGRAWMAIRDMDVAAEVIGIRPLRQADRLRRFARSTAASPARCGPSSISARWRAGGVRDRPLVPDPVHGHHRRPRHDPGLVPRRRLHHAAADLSRQRCRALARDC